VLDAFEHIPEDTEYLKNNRQVMQTFIDNALYTYK
jgi:hypothetical protein